MPATHRIIRLAMAFLGASILSVPLHAKSTEADLNARLKNKPLYLRGCWNNDNLHFDYDGKLVSKAGRVTITLCGFDLNQVHLDGNKLVLKGVRVGLVLADDKQKRVELEEPMHIEIDAPSSGDYAPALDAIFADNPADMVPLLPFYWQRYAQKSFLPPQAASTVQTLKLPTDTPPKHIGGRVQPPRLLRGVEPDFTMAARASKYGGKVLVNLWIEPDGSISHLSLVRPIGMGLDESALAAVQKYQFAPATQDGNPIRVELNLEVNFQLR
jgi:TonB family protein